MKNLFSLMFAAMAIAFSSCNNNKNADANADSVTTESQTTTYTSSVTPGNYVNLTTGKTVYVIPDPETGYAIDSITRVPIEFYINTANNDTLFQTGTVVNNELLYTDGKWSLSEDAKIKIDGDKMKIKDGDTKIKVDGDESKVKQGDDYKQKVEGDKTKTKTN